MMDYEVLIGDCIESMKKLPDESVDMCVTSPPYYGLRDYQDENQIGLEPTLGGYVENMVKVFMEVHRILKPHGTLWLNLGDSYNGSGGAGGDYNEGGLKEGQPKYPGRKEPTLKRKDLMGVPWRVAFALQEAGWYLRQDIIWAKPNCMPEPVKDRCTRSHEYIFMFSKKEKYFYDNTAIKEPVGDAMLRYVSNGPTHVNAFKHNAETRFGKSDANRMFNSEQALENVKAGRNKRDVWTVPPKPYSEAHFAVYPPDLIEPCILAGTSAKGCCSDCGAPWQRMLGKGEKVKQKWGVQSKVDGSRNDSEEGSGLKTGMVNTFYTLGWQPTCECHGKFVTKEVVIPAPMTKEQVGETNWGSKDGEYHGQNTKDFASAKAQSASDTKRRILENKTKDKVKKMLVYESDLSFEEHPITPAVVFDPFGGSGTTAGVAIKHGRSAILCELNPDYAELIPARIQSIAEIAKTIKDEREWL